MKGGLKSVIRAATAGIAAVALFGCAGQSNPVNLPDPNVYFVNASADSGNLSFLLNNNFQPPVLAYLQGSANFRAITFISEENEGYDVGTANEDRSFVYDESVFTFPRDTDWIVAAIGQANYQPGEELKRLRQVIFQVDRAGIGGSTSRLIILQGFNRSTGNLTPDVNFQNPGDNPVYRVPNIAYGSTATIDVASGNQTFVIKRSDGEAVYATTTLNLTGGLYLVILSGTEDAANPDEQPKITFLKLTTR
ncbi:MAG: hypothetical protein KF812_01300 [Fimbriimonadaceae bacterium]|nr:hypothetical protein [Fimbriimonadaceae bacterium]